MKHPETRLSLLARLRNPADRDAWSEFSEVYRPIIIRIAQTRGLQLADAEDLAQQVLLAVSGAIERFEADSKQAKFRTWLRRIAENAILNALARVAPDKAAGSDLAHWLLEHTAAREGPDSDLLQLEFRREIFNWAARQIRDEFAPSTWRAFWLTAVEGFSIEQVCEELQKSHGSVYAARSRVMKRLREKVEYFESE